MDFQKIRIQIMEETLNFKLKEARRGNSTYFERNFLCFSGVFPSKSACWPAFSGLGGSLFMFLEGKRKERGCSSKGDGNAGEC